MARPTGTRNDETPGLGPGAFVRLRRDHAAVLKGAADSMGLNYSTVLRLACEEGTASIIARVKRRHRRQQSRTAVRP